MDIWSSYAERIDVSGDTKRQTDFIRGSGTLNRKVPGSLSYQAVTIYDQDHGYNITTQPMIDGAIEQKVAVINSDNLNEKMILSLPGEDIENGSLVHWMDNYWLVTERDANTTLYTRAKMIQCNYLLRWVSNQKEIIEQWCVVEDGTKYLTGEFEDRNFIVSRGDSRIALTIARNKQTIHFGRERRFLIDEPESETLLAYTLSKPLKVGNIYNGKGAYKFVLQEVNSSVEDNHRLRIADYYKYFPKVAQVDDKINIDPAEEQRKVWL